MLLNEKLYGISEKDARILAASEDGYMLDYYMDVVHRIKEALSPKVAKSQKVAKLVANWYDLYKFKPTKLKLSDWSYVH